MSILYRGIEVGNFDALRKVSSQFKLGSCGVSKRTKKIKMLVLHWTGGEGGPISCFSTLQRRGLSVQFYMDQLGNVTQYCDMDYSCAHAGFVNSYSVGIEIANAGTGPADSRHPRQLYKTRLKGDEKCLLEFYPQQVDSVIKWCHELCRILSIPEVLLRDSSGNIATNTVDRSVISEFSGVVGHYQISDHKIDPGTQLLHALEQDGFK